MTKVAVVGCGVVGSSWALVFARAGYEVAVYDALPASVQQTLAFVRTSLESLPPDGGGSAEDVDVVCARLRAATSLEDALTDAAYVQESAPERLEIKRDLYQRLDAAAPPHVILASSTSGLPASSFTDHLVHRERCLVVHPINPPHLIPLVELVPAPWTQAGVLNEAAALMERVGQSPIRLNREINGFVVNRLQSALLGEAFRLVEDGLCSAADVDKAVADGLGLRWFFMGPFETIDLNAQEGVAQYCRNLGPMYYGLAKEQADPREWHAALVETVEAERRMLTPANSLPARRLWRDRCLSALVAAKRRVMHEEQT